MKEVDAKNLENKKIAELMANISGILIPVSLASITFTIGQSNISETLRNIFMCTIPLQIILLILTLASSFYSIQTPKNGNTELVMKIGMWIFFVALFLIGFNHIAILFSSQ